MVATASFIRSPNVSFAPSPAKPVPIIIGGHADLALKRAARVGDGWVSAGSSLEELTTMIGRINELRKEYGTDNTAISVSCDD